MVFTVPEKAFTFLVRVYSAGFPSSSNSAILTSVGLYEEETAKSIFLSITKFISPFTDAPITALASIVSAFSKSGSNVLVLGTLWLTLNSTSDTVDTLGL